MAPDDGVPGDEGPREIFERGGASWYGIQFHQRKTANGERFDMTAMTAAHKTLPFNTRVCVRSLVNGREVLVRINDRGPYASGRIIDLSRAAAEAIGMLGMGIKQVALSIDRTRTADAAAAPTVEAAPTRDRCAGRRRPQRREARPGSVRARGSTPRRCRRGLRDAEHRRGSAAAVEREGGVAVLRQQALRHLRQGGASSAFSV